MLTPISSIGETYSKSSLTAPLLAISKKEILLTTTDSNYLNVDSFLQKKIIDMRLNPKYLTIIAAPIAIQMEEGTYLEGYKEVDNHIYGDANSDSLQDMAVGRIFGITSSDVSAYIARINFMDYLPKSNNFALLVPAPFFVDTDPKGASRALKHSGFIDNSIYQDESGEPPLDAERDIKNRLFIGYTDHSSMAGWTGISVINLKNEHIKLYPSIVVGSGCLTCAYTASSHEFPLRCVDNVSPRDLFCANILKVGAVAYIGAVDATGGMMNAHSIIVNELLNGKTIGESFLYYKRAHEAFRAIYKLERPWTFGIINEELSYEPHFILLGDPTITIIDSPSPLNELQIFNEDLGELKKVNIHITQPDETIQFRDSTATDYTIYVMPSSEHYINGGGRMYRTESYVNFGMIEDILYWETDSSFGISDITTRIRFSDGTEKELPMEKRGNLYYYEDTTTGAYLLPIPVRRGIKFIMLVRDSLDFDKLIPSYEYEIEMQTSELLSPMRTYAEAMPT